MKYHLSLGVVLALVLTGCMSSAPRYADTLIKRYQVGMNIEEVYPLMMVSQRRASEVRPEGGWVPHKDPSNMAIYAASEWEKFHGIAVSRCELWEIPNRHELDAMDVVSITKRPRYFDYHFYDHNDNLLGWYRHKVAHESIWK